MMGGWEWIIIGAALFMLFGASRLPQLAKSLGQSRKAFKDGMREAEEDEIEDNKKRELNAAGNAGMSKMSDEELAAEMRRRVETQGK